jgi:hypothetical protein
VSTGTDSLAFELIGRAIFAWGRFEQTIIGQTWRSRDPLRKSPFPIGPIEPGFHLRWNEWCKIHQGYASNGPAFEQLRLRVKALSDFRDDLAHNVLDISYGPYGDTFSLHVRRQSFDWKTKWQRWANRYAHLPGKGRPVGPYAAQLLQYQRPDLEGFIRDTDAATDAVTEISEALVRAAQS